MTARRIITLQRQLRELGRIRSGYSEPYVKDGEEKRRAVRSKTFILTATTPDNLHIAAEMWGGTVERWQPMGSGPEGWRIITEAPAIDAILPPGDPLSQQYEFWNRGGAVRRCDGQRDEKSGGDCVCRKQFGDDWFERGKQEVCQIYTRLNVFLELSDFGYWRIETKSFYAAGEISGAVDLIKARIGPDPAVPIRLRIDPRTKVEAGKTTPYPVIVLELRGVATAQILAGVAPVLSLDGVEHVQPAVAAGRERPAIAAAPANGNSPPAPTTDLSGWYQAIADAPSLEALREVWKQLAAAKVHDEGLKQAFWARRAEFPDASGGPTPAAERVVYPSEDETPIGKRVVYPSEGEPAGSVAVAEPEPDRDAAWTRVLGLAGERGWNTAAVSQRMRKAMGKDPTGADGWDFQLFAEQIAAGAVA